MEIPAQAIATLVAQTLEEDIGSGDLTAALLPPSARSAGRLISRQSAVLCGVAWCSEAFHQVDSGIQLDWTADDGDSIGRDQIICCLQGPSRAILTAERSAINLLQTLSGTATEARRYADAVAGTSAKILDTRKTLPGMRLAQKYAVRIGGAHNHRIGLFDGILVKENHVRAAGGIGAATRAALRAAPADCLVEVEVDDLGQLDEALAAGAPRVLLDNFDLDALRTAVRRCNGRAALEASGNVTIDNVREVAETGVDYISVGSITKNLRAVDLSLEFET